MKLFKISFALNILFGFAYLTATSAVTNVLSGGRFGDNLVSLLHVLWIEYKLGIPLIYKPFPYSDQLVLHEKRKRYDDKSARNYNKVVELKENCFIEFQPQANTLYVIPYFPESLEEHRKAEYSPEIYSNLSKGMTRSWPYVHIDWQDQQFIAEIRSLIAPRFPVKLLNLPTNCITVAIHIRKNSGGYDLPLLNDIPANHYKADQQYMDVNYPLKFPPNSYYIEQIKLLADLFKDKKLYIYIFTDDPNPAQLAHLYAQAIQNNAIVFDCRKEKNGHDANVLDDFFSMLQFDCLIRSDSNFALVASKIGDYSIVLSPLHHKWVGKTLHIDKVALEMAK